jgi:hypothetical protein
VDPAAGENWPAGQFVHTEAPVVEKYVPAAQFVHTEAPAAEYVPAGHGVHVAFEVAPMAAEYVPAEQGVQVVVAAVSLR